MTKNKINIITQEAALIEIDPLKQYLLVVDQSSGITAFDLVQLPFNNVTFMFINGIKNLLLIEK